MSEKLEGCARVEFKRRTRAEEEQLHATFFEAFLGASEEKSGERGHKKRMVEGMERAIVD